MGNWRAAVATLPNFAPADFDPSTTALVIVDMQYVDAHPDYGLGRHLKEHYPAVSEYTTSGASTSSSCRTHGDCWTPARARGIRVVHLTVGPVLADGMDMVKLRRPKQAPGLRSMLYQSGTFEHQILPELAPIEGELVVNKTTRGAFNSTAIERLLLNLGIETIVVCGVSTSSCVETTARAAADRGFKTVIVEDATAELDEPSHEATLRQFAIRWGRVWTTDETLDQLGASSAATHPRPSESDPAWRRSRARVTTPSS